MREWEMDFKYCSFEHFELAQKGPLDFSLDLLRFCSMFVLNVCSDASFSPQNNCWSDQILGQKFTNFQCVWVHHWGHGHRGLWNSPLFLGFRQNWWVDPLISGRFQPVQITLGLHPLWQTVRLTFFQQQFREDGTCFLNAPHISEKLQWEEVFHIVCRICRMVCKKNGTCGRWTSKNHQKTIKKPRKTRSNPAGQILGGIHFSVSIPVPGHTMIFNKPLLIVFGGNNGQQVNVLMFLAILACVFACWSH